MKLNAVLTGDTSVLIQDGWVKGDRIWREISDISCLVEPSGESRDESLDNVDVDPVRLSLSNIIEDRGDEGRNVAVCLLRSFG